MVWTNAYELKIPDNVLGTSLYNFPCVFGDWALGAPKSYLACSFCPVTHAGWNGNPAPMDFSPAKVKFAQQRAGTGANDAGIGANQEHSLGWYLNRGTAFTLGQAMADSTIELQFDNLPASYYPVPIIVTPTTTTPTVDDEATARLRRATGLGDFAASFINLFDIG